MLLMFGINLIGLEKQNSKFELTFAYCGLHCAYIYTLLIEV